MKIYAVGGAVRDRLLGLPVKDQDYVVVGATPEQMEQLGYRPVGKDFPVFLHPVTHEEYALARTERKKGRGYKGFEVYAAPEVTLEQDLARRDLTINAIALGEDGEIVDPFGGVRDLRAGILRHVSPAFVEDPVRVLRVARFAARFGFAIAPETAVLMREMVANGEIDHLVPERVWQELSRGLMENTPSRMFEVLRGCGALARILPELDRLFGVPQRADYHPEIDSGIHVMMAVDCAARHRASLPVRFAVLVHDLGKGVTAPEQLPGHRDHEVRGVELVMQVCERLRVPGECRELAVLAARHHGDIHRAQELRPATVLRLLCTVDALRRPQRFEELLAACEYDWRGRAGFESQPYPQAEVLRAAAAAARAVDAGALANAAVERQDLPRRIEAARLAAVTQALAGKRKAPPR
ncbi:MAG TPA: multifunctional CCA addition/repair protein [Burkholderiales bacterium]|jgi:tRNA nucleotidyltransferase (CCA-adding enzyme)|nr:multifunctional CCA addition/repair protein [Burkholderiales bacterium]